MRQLTGTNLWLGNAREGRDARTVLDLGIQAVVDLALEESPAALTRELAYLRFPLLDGAGNPPWLLRAAVEMVADLLQAKVPTLVCCGAGMSRSPAIVAAAVAKFRRIALTEAIADTVSSHGPIDLSPALLADLVATNEH